MKKHQNRISRAVICILIALMAAIVSCSDKNKPEDTTAVAGEVTTDIGETGTAPAEETTKDSGEETTAEVIVPTVKSSVRFVDAEGNDIATVEGNAGDALACPSLREGYRTAVYYKDAACTDQMTPPDKIPAENAVIYVKYADPITYTVVFDAGEGIGQMQSLNATYDQKLELPASTFTSKDRVFCEWRLYNADGTYRSFVDCARIRNLTAKQDATVTLVAIYEGNDAANFTVRDGVAIAYTGKETTLVFPQTVKKISADFFAGNEHAAKVRKIIVPDSCTEIEKGAFANCKALTELTVPFIGGSADENRFLAYIFGADSYKDNGYEFQAVYNAMYGLQQKNLDLSAQRIPTGLKRVTVTGKLYTIPEGAFYRAYGLENLVLTDYDELYEIGNSAFEECWQLGYDSDHGVQNPLYWLENVEKIGDRAFIAYGSKENDEGSSYTYTRLFEIPTLKKIKSIGKEAFYGCVYLLRVDFGPDLETIGAYAFTSAASITSVTLPDKVTSIGEYAFTSCRALTEVTIGKGVRSFGAFAFADCTALTSVNISAEAPAKIALIPFSNSVEYKYNSYGQIEGFLPVYTHLKLNVPAGTVAAYKSAWIDYADRLKEQSENEQIYYFDQQPDGSFAASLRVDGDLIYVYDPNGTLLELLDIFNYGNSTSTLGTSYTLNFRLLDADTVKTVGDELFIEVTNDSIIDYTGDLYPTVLRVRPTYYERNGVSYRVPVVETLPMKTTLGDKDGSLFKIVDDGYGHATLYTRKNDQDAWTEEKGPSGTLYAELYLYVNLVYDEQYLAVVYQDKNAKPISHRYFMTSNGRLVPVSYADGKAMVFLSYGDVQLILDGDGNIKVNYFASMNYSEYTGKYTVKSGDYAGPSLEIAFENLEGDSTLLSGTAVLDGYFDGSFHRCKVLLRENGSVVYSDTVYSSGGRLNDRTCNSKDAEGEYVFMDYVSQDGATTFHYVKYVNADGNASHGTYRIDGDTITIDVEGFPQKVGTVNDIRKSFTLKGVFGDILYRAYGYDEDYTFYMEEDFYGTTLQYYVIRMDGYGNATIHDTHDDDIDVWYKGTYYNTGRSVGEDDYGTMWVYCFAGKECDARGNIKENGATVTYYYVTGTEVYEDDNYNYYGTILSISQSEGSSAYTVYDKKGLKFASMSVDPFGITELTVYSYTYENGEIVYTENTAWNENLSCVAYLDNSGVVTYVVVYDKAGNFLFCVTKEEDGTWVCEINRPLSPAPSNDQVILPDPDTLEKAE